jgi:hypothetical protein
LFAVFINDIIIRLQKSSLGCYVRNICFNAFMYADDLLLLSISISDLQAMINICKDELDWLDMKINIKKSMCMRVGNNFNASTCDILLDSTPIAWTTEIRYLGLYIVAARTFKCNLHIAKVKYFRSLNAILGKVGSVSPVNLALSLISSNCNPVLLYGLESVHLTKAQVQSLTYPFNSSFMKLFHTFDAKVISQCQFYCGYLPFKQVLDLRCLKFYHKLSKFDFSPAAIMFNWFGMPERDAIAANYGIYNHNLPHKYGDDVWAYLAKSLPL